MSAPLRSLPEVAPLIGGPWNHVGNPPDRKIHAAITRSLFHRAIGRMPIRVRFPDGTIGGAGGGDAPVMTLHAPDAFYRRVGSRRPDRVRGVVHGRRLGCRRPGRDAQALRRAPHRAGPRMDATTAAFLRSTSAAGRGEHAGGRTPEHRTPLRPVERPVRALPRRVDDVLIGMVHAGRHARDRGRPARSTGCSTRWGWRSAPACSSSAPVGARSRSAPRGAGANVTTLTISSEQQALARRRPRRRASSDRVDVQLRDYRDAEGQYDAVVSVEMIEAVGERYWPTYFAALDRLVTPHGRVGLQAICSTTPGWSPRATSTPGSRSTSSRAARSVDPGDRRRARARTPDCGSPSASTSATTTPDARTVGRNASTRTPTRSTPRVRRRVPPDVGSSTSRTAKRLRHRIPRRRATRPRAEA